MNEQNAGGRSAGWSSRRVPRRTVVRYGLLAIAAAPLVAACGRNEAAGSGAAGSAPAAQAPASGRPRIDGKLVVVQTRDFHPDHNDFVEQKIKQFAEERGYPLDHSYVEAYAGAGNVVAKLMAAVQAGDAPDVMTHTLRPAELKFLNVIEDVDALQKDIVKEYGDALPAMERRALLDGKWWAVQHFSRAAGHWAREKPFKDAGVDIRTDLGTFDGAREAAMKASKPDQESWGWGMTTNRSGDGETTVRNLVMASGGQLTDESGQVVVLNTEPYRQGALAGLNWLRDTYVSDRYARMLPPGVLAWTDPSNNEAYLAGKIFHTSNAGTLYAKAVTDGNPVADDTYMLAYPKGTGPQGRTLQGADGMRWFIMRGAKNRTAGEELIRYMVSKDVQEQIFKISTGYAYPAYQWGWDLPIIAENKYAQHVTPVWKEIAFDPSGYTQGEWPGPPTPWVASLESSNFWTDMFGEVLTGAPPQEALANAHDRAVRVFKEFGAKGA